MEWNAMSDLGEEQRDLLVRDALLRLAVAAAASPRRRAGRVATAVAGRAAAVGRAGLAVVVVALAAAAAAAAARRERALHDGRELVERERARVVFVDELEVLGHLGELARRHRERDAPLAVPAVET